MNEPVVVSGVGLVEAPSDAALAAGVAGLPEKQLRHADRVGLLAVAATRRALQGARLLPAPYQVGLAMGVGFGTYEVNARHQRRILEEGIAHASPAEFTLTLPNMTAAIVSIAFGLRGETSTFADGTLAGATALGAALDRVRESGHPVLVGGAECHIPEVLRGLRLAGCWSPGAWPEFGAALVLEPVSSARARGAEPLAIVDGYGANTGPSEDPVGAALRAAVRDAQPALAADWRPPRANTPFADERGQVSPLPAALALARIVLEPPPGISVCAFANPACMPGARAIILRAP